MVFRQFKLFALLVGSFMLIMGYSGKVFPQQESGSEDRADPIAFLDLMITEDNPIHLKNENAAEAISKLRWQYGCPISIERIEYTQQDCIPQGNNWIVKNRPRVSRSFSNVTVREVLTELARLDPGYQWNVYEKKFVSFEPRTKKLGGTEKSVLDTLVSVDATNVPLSVLLSPAHPFGRELSYQYGLALLGIIKGINPEFHKIRISVQLKNVSLREAFNQIAAEAESVTGDLFCWSINGRKIEGRDQNGKLVTARNFTFSRFRQEFLRVVRDSH
jgi:hypothetical protein